MQGVFTGATHFNQPLNNWNVSKVTNMKFMFYLTQFNQPLNNWNVSNVTNMQGMFYGATHFNQNIRMWNTSNVSYYTRMFSYATQMHIIYTGVTGFGDTPTSSFFNQGTTQNTQSQNTQNYTIIKGRKSMKKLLKLKI